MILPKEKCNKNKVNLGLVTKFRATENIKNITRFKNAKGRSCIAEETLAKINLSDVLQNTREKH